MNLKRLSISLLAGLCLTAPHVLPSHALAEMSKPPAHWGTPLLESLQKQKLYLTLKADAKTFGEPITDKLFQSMLSELWLSETVTLPPESATTAEDGKLTRQEAADRIFAVFSPYVASEEMTAVDWVKATGIMKGYPNGDFKENEKVSLAQGVATMKNIKDYFKAQPDLVHKIAHPDTTLSDNITYITQANAKGTLDFTLSWGEKKTGGYAITITETKIIGSELHVYFKTKAPGPEDIVTQAFTYPKATVTLDMTQETYKTYKVILHETKQ